MLLNLAPSADHDDTTAWAGAAWREYVGTNTRVLHATRGVSIASDDLARTRRLYTSLGFSFVTEADDAGGRELQADTPRGSFLQLRAPRDGAAPSAAQLQQRGAGLFHIVFDADDLDGVRERLGRAGTGVARTTTVAGKPAFWTLPAETFGVPFEIRRRRE